MTSPDIDRVFIDLAVFDVGTVGVSVRETFRITTEELVDRLAIPSMRPRSRPGLGPGGSVSVA